MPVKKIYKETILKRAIEIFREKGYYHASLSDLAEGCQIEKPHFYYYFKDKKDLMKSVLEYTNQFIDQYILCIAFKEELTPSERLRQMMKNVFKINTMHPHGCLMGNTILETIDSEPEFKPILKDYFDNWIKSLSHLYQFQYPEKDALEFASEDLQKLEGSIMLSRLYDDFSILKGTIRQISTRIK